MCTRAHDAVVSEDRVIADISASTNPHILTDDDPVAELRVGIDLGALGDPQTLAGMNPGDEDARLSLEDIAMHVHVALAAADVAPVAVSDDAVDRMAIRHQAREELGGEIERCTFRDVVEHPRLNDVDAGVDRIAEDLAPRRLLQEALDAASFVRDHNAEVERIGDPFERDSDRAALLLVIPHDFVKIDVGYRISGDDEERLIRGEKM